MFCAALRRAKSAELADNLEVESEEIMLVLAMLTRQL
jgi:hypothetical protein